MLLRPHALRRALFPGVEQLVGDRYAGDFGGERGVRALLARALGVDEARMAGIRLRYRAYDWTSVV